MKLAWGNKVDSDFRNKVADLCKNLGWSEPHASWLMACIAFESAETFDPSIRNAAGSGATGLIQFMPRTADGLGTTTQDLAAMTAVEQLSYVKDYMKPYAAKIRSLSDMYMAILSPKNVGKDINSVLYSEGAAYRMNAPLDTNSDGKITKGEATQFVRAKLEKGLSYGNWFNIAWEDDSIMTVITRMQEDLLKLKTIIAG